MGATPSDASNFTELRTPVQIRESQLNRRPLGPQWQLLGICNIGLVELGSTFGTSWIHFQKNFILLCKSI